MEILQTKVMEILKREVSLDNGKSVKLTTSLRKELELDSLDLSLFFLAIQEEFEVKIVDEEAAKLDSVNGVVELLQEKSKEV